MAFSQSVRKGQVPVNCNLCETNRTIQWKCMDCSILMCGYCTDKVHSKFKNANDHKIISLKDVGMHREEMDFTNIKCLEHTEQSSCLYCNECEILVCPTCVAKVHKKHDLIEISDSYNIKVKILKKGQNELQKSNSKMNAKKNQLNKLVSAENIKYYKEKQNILSHEKTVKEQVEQYFEELKNKLEQSHKTVLTSVKSDLNTVSLFTNKKEDKITEVQNCIDISNAPEFFKVVKKMEKFTETQEPQTKPSYTSSPKFVPGNITQSNIGSLQDDGNLSSEINISLVINSEYQTELDAIAYVSPCLDHSIWLSSGIYDILQRVKPEGTKLTVLSKFDTKVIAMTITPSNQLLLGVLGETRLQQISINGDLIDSVYDVEPFYPGCINAISDNKLIIGAQDGEHKRSAVIIMNNKGDKEAVYEHDEHNQPLVINPRFITCTSNGNLHVVDQISDDCRKIVILGQEGHMINEYTGYSTINKSTPFKPAHIVTTPSENVVVMDFNTDILHILNDNGHYISHFNTEEIGIEFPYSLAFNTTGQLYIGCNNKNAKLYEIKIEGF